MIESKTDYYTAKLSPPDNRSKSETNYYTAKCSPSDNRSINTDSVFLKKSK